MKLDTFQTALLEQGGEDMRGQVLAYFDALNRSEKSEQSARDTLLIALMGGEDFRPSAIAYLEKISRAENQRRTEREKLLRVLKS